MPDRSQLPHLGWLERATLPSLGVTSLQAKIDTGAKTSSLHAEELELVDVDGVHVVRFAVDTGKSRFQCECPVHDERHVKSSSGHEELRIVIKTECIMNGQRWPIELTLTDRTAMRFPMLLGRRAMTGRFLVDPGRKYVGRRPLRKKKKKRKEKE